MAKISIIQGTSLTINVSCVQSDGTTPIDITGGKIYFTVQNVDNPPDDTTDLVFQKTVSSFSSPTLGLATVSLAPSDTSGVTAGNYFYDAKLIESGGTQIAIAQDKFTVKPAITRSTS